MSEEQIKGQQTIDDLLGISQNEAQEPAPEAPKQKRRKYRRPGEEPAERWFMSVNFTYNSPYDVEMIEFLKHIPNKAYFVKKLIWFAMKAEGAIHDQYQPYFDEPEISEDPEPDQESEEPEVLPEEPAAPKKRGRPRKVPSDDEPVVKRPVGRPRKEHSSDEPVVKRPVGRPRKERTETEPKVPKKRGRPRKSLPVPQPLECELPEQSKQTTQNDSV